MSAEEQIKRTKSLLKSIEEEQLKKKILEVLPQGHGSGLDADLLDGLHAAEIIAKCIGRGGGGGGGGGVSVHGKLTGLDVDDHTFYALADKSRPNPWVAETDVPVLTDAKYPNALLLDGTRAMTGNLKTDGITEASVAVGITIYKQLYANVPSSIGTNLARFGKIWCTGLDSSAAVSIAGGLTLTSGVAQLRDITNDVADTYDVGKFDNKRRDGWFSRFVSMGTVLAANVPSAGVNYRGVILTKDNGIGVADDLIVCLKDKAGNLSWKTIVSG